MNDRIDIDWEQLHQVSEHDTEFEWELLTMLAEDVKLHIEDLRQAIIDGDLLAVSHEAHYIKGASANVGVRPITNLAQQLEDLARKNLPIENSAPIVEQMSIEITHLEAYLAS